jgi:malonyl-CoA O-methyltransferase
MDSKMTVKKQFSKYANRYDNNNIIQRIISKALVREIKSEPKSILELGCGNGQIYREFNSPINRYTAIDFSKNMCELHPKNANIDIHCFDFDSDDFFKFIKKRRYDLIVSSSALQWSKNLKKLLDNLSNVSNKIECVLFTSNTFKRIYEITRQKEVILNLEEIKDTFSRYRNDFEVINYKLEFENKKDMFRYIKNSGVQGDVNLSYKEAKELYKRYDLDYLEFEVVFIKSSLNLK